MKVDVMSKDAGVSEPVPGTNPAHERATVYQVQSVPILRTICQAPDGSHGNQRVSGSLHLGASQRLSKRADQLPAERFYFTDRTLHLDNQSLGQSPVRLLRPIVLIKPRSSVFPIFSSDIVNVRRPMLSCSHDYRSCS